MNVVTLHVLKDRPSADFGMVRVAAPALDPDARVVVFDGLPPDPIPTSPHVAPVVLQGDVDGHRVYAERVPVGLGLHELELPPSMAPWIGAGLLAALAHLRQCGLVHGRVAADRVQVGMDGSIVLFGRGRVGGTFERDRAGADDILAVLDLTADSEVDLDDVLTHLRSAADPSDGQALGAIVRKLHKDLTVLDQIHIQVGPTPDSLDEIQPDLGPDRAHEPGLLDRWSVTTHHGGSLEHTDELTGSVPHSSSPLALTLWTALAAPVQHAPPDDRFSAVDGEPSRGLRALLVEEPPDTLPGLLGGAVPAFLLDADVSLDDDDDTTEDTPYSGISPLDDEEEDGDTAVYDMRDMALSEAIRKADRLTTIADLEARISDAERRAREAERRARAAEQEARFLATDRVFTPPTEESETRGLSAFLRVEVFIVAALVLLMAWLVWMAFG